MPPSNRDQESQSTPTGRMVPGKYVILAIFGLAIGASIASLLFYARLQRRPIELWGSRAATLMLRAPTARIYRLTRVAADDPRREAEDSSQAAVGEKHFSLEGRNYVASDMRDITSARGLSHIRQGLIHDRSFAWAAPPGDDPRWEYAIEFDDQGERAMVAFNFHSARAALVDSGASAAIKPVVGAFEDFVREQYPEAAPAATPSAKE